jgi:hypothetical protein
MPCPHPHQVAAPPLAAPLEVLRPGARLYITPIFPVQCAKDEFHLTEQDAQNLQVSKSSGHQIRIPRALIRHVLHGDYHEPATIVLDGRLQWLSSSRSWKVFPEAPSTPRMRK